MEYKRITSKGGVNIPVKLRRSMGMEPRDAIELEVNDRNELVIRAYQPRCIYCGSGEIHLKKNGKGVCRACADQLVDEYVKQKRKVFDVLDRARTFGAHRRDQQRHTRTDVGRSHARIYAKIIYRERLIFVCITQ